MSIRVDIQMDQGSESLGYLATATVEGNRLHEVAVYGGPEARDEAFREMVAWLKKRRYREPDHYWVKVFPQ